MNKSFVDLVEEAFIKAIPNIDKVANKEKKSIIDYVFEVVKRNVDYYPLHD